MALVPPNGTNPMPREESMRQRHVMAAYGEAAAVYLVKRSRYVPRKGRWDEMKLWQLGYKQELQRTFSMLTNACCAAATMSIWVATDSYATQGLAYGGPVVVIWGWVLVSCLSVAIALCMAELVSAFPTSGGMYYWSFMLAPRKHRLLACWLTGWMNLLGQVANTASLELGLTKFVVNTLVKLHTVGPGEQPGYQATPYQAMAVLAALLILHAALNSMGHGVTRVMLVFSGLWNVVATLGFCAMLVGVAPTHQTASFALTKWRSGSETSGISSSLYICVVGLLMSQWSIMGYDACVHLAEETVDVGTSVSWGLVLAVAGSCGVGLCTLLCLNFSMQSLDNLVKEDSVTTGMAQLTWDVFKARYGYGHGSIASMSSIVLVAMFMSCLTAITANSRMVYAFSRDGAMLGSRWWRLLSARGQQPVAGAWLMALLSFLLGLPGVFMPQYLKALSAACVVALTLSYGTPIALSMWRGPEGYVHGPWHLGRWSRPLAAVSCTWILFISIVFCLPMAYPMTPGNANWAPLILSLLLAFALLLWWAPGFGGIHWFKGPVPNVSMPLPGSSQAAPHTPTPQAAGAGPAPGTQAVTMPALPSTNSHPAGPGSGSVDSKLRKRNARCAERLLQTYSGFSPSSTAAPRPSSQQSTEGRLSMGSQSRRASSQALGQLVPHTAHTACPAPSCTLPKELGRPLPSHTAGTASLAGHSQQGQPHAAELVGAGASPAPPPGASQRVPTEPLPMAQRSSASTRAHHSSRPSSSLATTQVRVRISANALVADLHRDSCREGQAPALQPWVAVPALRLRHSQPARAPQSSCEAAAAAFVQPQPASQRVESGAGMLEQLPHWVMGSSSGRPSSPMPQPPPSLHPPRHGVQASGTGNPAHPSSAPPVPHLLTSTAPVFPCRTLDWQSACQTWSLGWTSPSGSHESQEGDDDQFSALLGLMADPLGTHSCLLP